MCRILIVEDDESIRGQVCFALEKEHSMTPAGSLRDVESISDIYQYDIAIVDLGLPPQEQTITEGLKVIDYLLQNSQCKIIILTGQGGDASAAACLERGCFDFLTKPVMMNRLMFSIERAVLFLKTEKELQKSGVEKIEYNVKIGDGLQILRETAEKNIIFKVLNDTGFNVYQSAKLLAVKRESLYYFMKKFNMVRKNDD